MKTHLNILNKMKDEKDLRKEEITRKWADVLQGFNIRTKYYEKVAGYLHNFALSEAANTSIENLNKLNSKDENSTLVPLNLKIITKINDLSKVEFVIGPMFVIEKFEKEVKENEEFRDVYVSKTKAESVSTIETRIKIPVDEYTHTGHYGKSWVEGYEDILAELIAKKINEKIDEGYTPYVYILVQSIMVIDENKKYVRINGDGRESEVAVGEITPIYIVANSRMKFIKNEDKIIDLYTIKL